mgnify:CR=1 FL=1
MNSTQQWQSVTWFDVDEHQDGQRIDNFLFTRLKGVPKSRIYRLIREGQVRVNKKRITTNEQLIRIAWVNQNTMGVITGRNGTAI